MVGSIENINELLTKLPGHEPWYQIYYTGARGTASSEQEPLHSRHGLMPARLGLVIPLALYKGSQNDK